MGQSTPALLAFPMGAVKALLAPARGRHSAAARRGRVGHSSPIPRPRPSEDPIAAPDEPQPGEFDELAALVRVWQAQRTRRSEAARS